MYIYYKTCLLSTFRYFVFFMIDKPVSTFLLPDVKHFAADNFRISILADEFEVEFSDFVVFAALIFLVAQLK